MAIMMWAWAKMLDCRSLACHFNDSNITDDRSLSDAALNGAQDEDETVQNILTAQEKYREGVPIRAAADTGEGQLTAAVLPAKGVQSDHDDMARATYVGKNDVRNNSDIARQA
jgi:hypothetical protein